MYLAWFDDNAKKKSVDKIADAVARYKEKFGRTPNVVLVNTGEIIETGNIEVRYSSYVSRGNYWVGFDETLVEAPELQKVS